MCPAPERQPASAPATPGSGQADAPHRLAQLERENAELKAGLRRELEIGRAHV